MSDSTNRPRNIREVDRNASCDEQGHVFGPIIGNVRHCLRSDCTMRDGLDPDDFVTADGQDIYDHDDPDRDQLGYDSGDAYVLKVR